jgi:hypothetical protein
MKAIKRLFIIIGEYVNTKDFWPKIINAYGMLFFYGIFISTIAAIWTNETFWVKMVFTCVILSVAFAIAYKLMTEKNEEK